MPHKAETKLCEHCKRPFENRKRWRSRNQFAAVKYCSDACRRKVKKYVS